MRSGHRRASAAPVGVTASGGHTGTGRADTRGSAVRSDTMIVEALRTGDEDAFASVVSRYSPMMLRLAGAHVPNRAVAEEVVQDTWLAVLQGIDRFEQRSSLRTWLFRILLNTARTRGVRERRAVPSAGLSDDPGPRAAEPSVDQSRFLPADDPHSPGHWAQPPLPWPRTPEDETLSGELREQISDAVDQLPDRQRAVLVLRDVYGWGSVDVCEALDVSPVNQRVLLHRARAYVRATLEAYLGRVPAA